MNIEPLRGDLQRKLTAVVIERIHKAPKPTKISEVLAVARELRGTAVSIDEAAQVINVAEPGRDIKARASDYDLAEIERHPNLLVVRTPRGTYVRYTESK
jgi:hypothetical protein